MKTLKAGIIEARVPRLLTLDEQLNLLEKKFSKSHRNRTKPQKSQTRNRWTATRWQ